MKEVLIGEERFAPDAALVWAEVSVGSQRRRVTRRRFVMGGVAAGVVAIATAATVVELGSDRTALPPSGPTAPPTTAAAPTGTTSATQGRSTSPISTTASTAAAASPAGTAAALARGHWRSLPAAPIAARGEPVAVWTGTEMLVWGGFTADTLLADGAAYDARRRTWRKLPAAPAGARARWTGLWTGTSLLLWGVANLGQDTRPTGARYTPSTDRWQLLPDPPIGISHDAQAVWTGSAMVSLAIPAGDEPERIDAASYDPGSDAWSSLPPVILPAGHPVLQMKVAAADGAVYLLSQWQHSSGGMTTAGTDCFVLDNEKWRPVTFNGGSGINGSQPIWTGKVFIQPAAVDWSGFHPSPVPMNLIGRVLDPATRRVTDQRHGPVDDFGGRSIWTGSALITFDTDAFTSGGGKTHYPGEAAVWDPTSGSWTSLPSPGVASYETPAAVWTGTSLLMWGQFYHSKDANSATATQPFAAGLEFVASP